MFHTLISNFEPIFPSSMGPWSAFSHTQQIVWWVESRLQFATTLLFTYIRESGNNRGARRRFENGPLVENTHTFGPSMFFFIYSKSSLTVFEPSIRSVDILG